ncbi:polyamine ABC transporter substrate-binding protein [filamentous cyanobacterium CCP2]|nr:polyamine ABC transporter substrate-binding protein [filamentous cyanobacterium CCP2]
MNRRSFLVTASSLTLMQLLAGCNRASTAGVEVRLLEDSVPLQVLREFQRQVRSSQAINFSMSSQLADLFDLLQTWREKANGQQDDRPSRPFFRPRAAAPQQVANLMTLGDYWLTPAIQQNLIQPLDVEEIPGWEQLAEQEIWQTLVRRNQQGEPSETGEVWAAPYRWGTLMIAYRRDRLEENGIPEPTDWQDLWQPALQRRISLPDSPRSVIGLTLKHLGRSANTEDLTTLPNLLTELEALHQQTKFYSSEAYLQPLILGDTWMAVGWSTEILQVVERNQRIGAVVPAAGTLLTADLWVRPAVTANQETTPRPGAEQANSEQANSEQPSIDLSSLLREWIAFFWQPSIATQLSLLSFAASPIFTGVDPAQIPAALANTPLLPSPEVLQASEFLLPLSDDAIDQYQQVWLQVRQ